MGRWSGERARRLAAVAVPRADCIGIENDPHSIEIAQARIAYWREVAREDRAAHAQQALFPAAQAERPAAQAEPPEPLREPPRTPPKESAPAAPCRTVDAFLFGLRTDLDLPPESDPGYPADGPRTLRLPLDPLTVED